MPPPTSKRHLAMAVASSSPAVQFLLNLTRLRQTADTYHLIDTACGCMFGIMYRTQFIAEQVADDMELDDSTNSRQLTSDQ